jgi:raffinose/stachyose/melibiose transport system permease protein
MSKNRIYKKAFVIPALSFYLLLFILPVVLNFGYSFTNWNAIKLTGETARWVGVKNYAKIFSDPELLNVILRTILYASVTTVFKNVIGFILALGLNEGLKTKSILRAIFFMPSMLSPLIIGLIFGTLLMPTGFFNQFLGLLGIHSSIAWTTTESTALGSVMCVDIWKQAGFNMVIYLAGLQLIDSNYYEAAAIDGAGSFEKLVYITVPRMLPSFIINLLLNMSSGLKTFDLIYVITNGGPDGATELINTMVYKQYGQKLYGMSAAYGVIVFIITAVFGAMILCIKDDTDN